MRSAASISHIFHIAQQVERGSATYHRCLCDHLPILGICSDGKQERTRKVGHRVYLSAAHAVSAIYASEKSYNQNFTGWFCKRCRILMTEENFGYRKFQKRPVFLNTNQSQYWNHLYLYPGFVPRIFSYISSAILYNQQTLEPKFCI